MQIVLGKTLWGEQESGEAQGEKEFVCFGVNDVRVEGVEP
jgi:hypothetical protein